MDVERRYLSRKASRLISTLPAFTITVSGELRASYMCILISLYPARYWENPNEFIPERFLGDYPKDAFLPFSGGTLLISLESIRFRMHLRSSGLYRSAFR